jgi:hypothetical protein
MGFLSGRVTYVRYRVDGPSPLPFEPEHLEKVEAHVIGRHGAGESADGVSVGWAGGEHVLDTTFDWGKNVVNDALHLGMRIDADKIPGDLLRAYTQIELAARAAENPSGQPTRAQKQEAKEAARQRAEAEGADGRFRRRKNVSVLWDGRENVLYAGTTSAAALDRLLPLFRDTFGLGLEPLTAGRRVGELADATGEGGRLDDLGPSGFVGDESPGAFAWAGADPVARDFLGNEFLVWLWHTLQNVGDTIDLADGSDVAVMLTKTLTLDCPFGQTGCDSLRDEGPTRLPEALRALQAGKLPRKVGLILVRHGQQYELTLQAETMAVNGLALPRPEGLSRDEAKVARVDLLREGVETLDLLLDAFRRRRTGPDWKSDLGRIRGWLTAA